MDIQGIYLNIDFIQPSMKICAKGVEKKSGSKPKNPKLYASVKAEAKRKFKVYPSAYANAWLVRTYKKRGGTY